MPSKIVGPGITHKLFNHKCADYLLLLLVRPTTERRWERQFGLVLCCFFATIKWGPALRTPSRVQELPTPDSLCFKVVRKPPPWNAASPHSLRTLLRQKHRYFLCKRYSYSSFHSVIRIPACVSTRSRSSLFAVSRGGMRNTTMSYTQFHPRRLIRWMIYVLHKQKSVTANWRRSFSAGEWRLKAAVWGNCWITRSFAIDVPCSCCIGCATFSGEDHRRVRLSFSENLSYSSFHPTSVWSLQWHLPCPKDALAELAYRIA